MADGRRYADVAAPFLGGALQPGDLVLTDDGAHGICRAYNSFIDEALTHPDCEALVLMHDDVEIHDPNFRAKILNALRDEQVAIVGAVGGLGLKSMEWWDARDTAGMVYETRGPVVMKRRSGAVDVLDGLLMAFSPSTLAELRFDEQRLPAFHGYDVDICLQARALGRQVVVRELDLFHRTLGGYGDRSQFDAASVALTEKWQDWIQPDSRVATLRQRWSRQAMRFARAAARRTRLVANRMRGRALPTGSAAVRCEPEEVRAKWIPQSCVACRSPLLDPGVATNVLIVKCDTCGTGATWPPPSRDVRSDGLFAERYGDSRLSRRNQWFLEARARLNWIQLHVTDGVLVEPGCATGEFASEAAQSGFETYGIEASSWAAEQARLLGVDVTAGFLSDWRARFPAVRADVFAIWHVLEHVPDPDAILDEIIDVLRPGGFLFLEIPNFESKEAERLGIEWDGAQPGDHFFHYTTEGIRRLLSRHGFTMVEQIQMSSRVYVSADVWTRNRNEAMLHRRPWPPKDLLRVAARAPSLAGVSWLADLGRVFPLVRGCFLTGGV